ncbi:MFS transporter [Kocuria salsicia]|uniref:MFS transporter n=1 Tax=Kocuria salsicia TaxID=664639 RepID=UPI00314501DD
MTSSRSYRRLITDREIGPLLFAANFGRLSGGLVPFGLVAFYSDRQEYTHAGVAAATLMVVSSLTAPYKGRLITRHSPRATIVPMSLVFALLLGTGVALNAAGASFVVAMAGIVSGAAIAPPTPAVVRAIWTNVAETPSTNRALHALDSTTEELTFAISPLITSALWATVGAFWSIPVGLCAGVLGNVAIVALASRPEASSHALMTQPLSASPVPEEPLDPASSPSKGSVYLQPAAVGLLLPMVGLGVAMGGLSLILPAWSGQNLGAEAVSGVLLSITSFAGFLAGLAFGKLPVGRVSARVQYQGAAALIAVGVLLFMVSEGLVLAVLGAICLGVGMTPMFIASYIMVGDYFADASHTEMNAALGSSFNIGDGIATAACGFALVALGTSNVLLALAVCTIALAAASVLLPRIAVTQTARKG